MRVFLVQLRKELRELVRTRKLFIVVVVLLAFGLMSPIFAKITPDLLEALGEDQLAGVQIIIPEPSTRDANEQFVKNTTQFGLLLAVLVGFGAIVGERERGQLALIFPHPLPRRVFVLAKFAALAILFGVALLVGAIADYAYTVLLFDAPDAGGFLALVALLYVWLLCLIGLTLLASALGRNMTTAGAIAFGLVLLVSLVGTFTRLAPGALTEWGRLLANGMDAPARWGALVVTLALTAASVAASALILERQEIE
jgi:ABC-2 type transport system permease protein